MISSPPHLPKCRSTWKTAGDVEIAWESAYDHREIPTTPCPIRDCTLRPLPHCFRLNAAYTSNTMRTSISINPHSGAECRLLKALHGDIPELLLNLRRQFRRSLDMRFLFLGNRYAIRSAPTRRTTPSSCSRVSAPDYSHDSSPRSALAEIFVV